MGNTTASAVASGGGLINPDPLKLIYSAARNEWVAYDLQNNELASDLTSLRHKVLRLPFLVAHQMEMRLQSVHLIIFPRIWSLL